MSAINNNIQNAVNCVSCCALENIEREDANNHEVYIGNSQTTCACYEPSRVFNEISDFIVTECDCMNVVWMCTLGLKSIGTIDARSCPAGCTKWNDLVMYLPENLSITSYEGTRGALYAMDLTACGYNCKGASGILSSFINIGKSYCNSCTPTDVSTMNVVLGCCNCYKAGQHNVAIMACPSHISFSACSCNFVCLEASVMRIY